MSIFSNIMTAIFGNQRATGTTATSPAATGTESAAPPASTVAQPASTAAQPAKTVDVAAILDKATAAHRGEKLEWRTSIVDLLKALDIDSSHAARKELAKELGYTGDSNDSATMNVWLHKQVMSRLAANGGKLPPEIRH
jgi:hypothetical protein